MKNVFMLSFCLFGINNLCYMHQYLKDLQVRKTTVDTLNFYEVVTIEI